MKVYLHSIGCRLNQSEIETMARQLLAAGHEIVDDTAVADTAIINTCAVTAAAARDGRNLTRRLHRANPAAEVVLTGCYATIAPQELARVAGAGRIVPNREKDQLVQLLDPQARINLPVFDQEPVLRELRSGAGVRAANGIRAAGVRAANTRAFVKVQDGCNNRCTFCITTIARGPGQSRPLGDVVAEVQALAAAGYQEAVLTGVHLGSYGRDFGNANVGLRDLAQALLTHTDIPRLRLSSLEPWDLEPDFFTLWANPRLLPHLHLPLQSGSDAILRRMARRTSRAAFRELVEAARAAIPDLNLSTDLILGFPGETEADFQDSLDYVRAIGFGRLHAFPYSRRPGTAAAQMPDQIPGPVRKARTRRMIALGEELSLAYHRRYVGCERPVLWEQNVGADKEGLLWSGYTDNYIRVTAHGPADLFNRVTAVHLTSAHTDGMRGAIVAAEA
jgi:threonylcarbamoyladenosine tRNA methylthiotransferase MtaB